MYICTYCKCAEVCVRDRDTKTNSVIHMYGSSTNRILPTNLWHCKSFTESSAIVHVILFFTALLFTVFRSSKKSVHMNAYLFCFLPRPVIHWLL